MMESVGGRSYKALQRRKRTNNLMKRKRRKGLRDAEMEEKEKENDEEKECEEVKLCKYGKIN